MGKTQVTSIRVNEELLRDAKDLGLNVSKVAENALKAAVEAMQTSNAKGGFSGRAFAKQKGGGAPSGIRTRGVGSTGLHVWPPKSSITSD